MTLRAVGGIGNRPCLPRQSTVQTPRRAFCLGNAPYPVLLSLPGSLHLPEHHLLLRPARGPKVCASRSATLTRGASSYASLFVQHRSVCDATKSCIRPAPGSPPISSSIPRPA